ncbi:hypothetical protein MPTK1_7g12120 [Marchantia polymorpha subsp. ruderalis]|uniref:Protein root UVB sensitive/RUS domain-containing protein n=2 Tax=Marchantia polymorpha TaxID=3197 RepID=A0AAF6BYN2_MARPO|nr:hypothetical protein MARPO_0003s0225 [Marchantia polymorpha]BBN17116.1 hypothetical protein Mp_7g12120 [Marchantia polymorpha subsp. ruderalis]|eukprot:PTQ49355.1 hypothetical protein MARPO_0003s0225 [Marchantia polymorpha]
MLGFPAVSARHHELRIVRAGGSNPWGGGRCLDCLHRSKCGVSYGKRRRQDVIAADCGNFGKVPSFDFANSGRGLAQHVCQILSWKFRRSEVQKLPIFFYKDGQQLQFAWDGQSLLMEPADQKVDDGGSSREHQFYWSGVGRMRRSLRKTFVPEHVRPHYLSYMRWKFMHRVLSSVLQVQCTQAMLQAIGIGARRALPAAAGLNWVLKDGLGRLGRLAYSGSLGSTFDSNLKRVRFSTSILFSLSLGLEMLTPYFPSYFLILATVANIGRSIALAAYLATSSAIHKSFAIGDNLADVAAKGQVQTVVADNLGLAVSCALSTVIRTNRRLEYLLLVLFPILTGLDLYAIYHELQAVHLQTLNKVRLEIIVEKWLRKNDVPSTEEVSIIEGSQFFQFPAQTTLPLRIGALKPAGWNPDDLLHVFQSQSQQPYALFRESQSSIPLFHQTGLLLWLKDEFTPRDVITGALQVAHLRDLTSSSRSPKLEPEDKEATKRSDPHLEIHDATDRRRIPRISQEGWLILVERSRQQALADVDALLAAMEMNGWQTKHILLAPDERRTYSTHLRRQS